MEIDAAGFNASDFNGCNSDEAKRKRHRELMRDRCKCCGSKAHKFEDGNHRGTKCNYCGKDNHYERVCLNKVLGKPKAEQVRATDTSSSTTSSSSSSDSGNGEALAAIKDQLSILQKSLAAFQ